MQHDQPSSTPGMAYTVATLRDFVLQYLIYLSYSLRRMLRLLQRYADRIAGLQGPLRSAAVVPYAPALFVCHSGLLCGQHMPGRPQSPGLAAWELSVLLLVEFWLCTWPYRLCEAIWACV
jgi:hypothetical protein